MSQDSSMGADRRDFLKAGAVASATAMTLAGNVKAQEPNNASKPTLPTRKLGKTGVDVTILNQGTWKSEGLARVLRFGYSSGIRYFDTAKSYGSEPEIKKWFEQSPEVRKQIFLVTKDSPNTPKQMLKMLDERLAALGTDYIDLFFVHALGDHHSKDEAVAWPKSKEFKEIADKIRKSGKAKFVGFSTHHEHRAEIIQSAAEGGIVDAIMVQYSSWAPIQAKGSPLDRALDAAHEKGIGLISMKQVAGTFGNANQKIMDEVSRHVPVLAEKKLTPFQGLLHAIWTDERISSSCVSMRNLDQIRENVDAARRFEPLKMTEILQLRDAVLAHNPTLCADCDGRCSLAAGTKAELGNLTRFLTYHEHHGLRSEARRHYIDLHPDARDWSGADLAAATKACPNGLDFARLLPEVEKHLA